MGFLDEGKPDNPAGGGGTLSDTQAITLWAKVKSEMRDASDAVLTAHGLSWEAFNQLERDAASQMTDDLTITEYGTVQKIPDGPIQYKIRRLDKPDEELTRRKKLKLHKRNPLPQPY